MAGALLIFFREFTSKIIGYSERRIARFTADAKLLAEAIPLPAIENPVPWSGLVLTYFKFIEILTALSNSRAFKGASPWS